MEKLIRNNHIIYALTLSVLAMAAVSCTKDDISVENNGMILMAPQSDQPIIALETKGMPAFTENLKEVLGDQGMMINASVKETNGWKDYFNDILLDWDAFSNTWKSSAGTFYAWQASSPLNFWAVAPADAPGMDLLPIAPDAQKIAFEYVTPKGIGDEEGKSDAEVQSDVMVAFEGNVLKETHAGFVNLQLKHTMSAVIFKAGMIEEGTLESITIKNVYENGKCTFCPANSKAITWNFTGCEANGSWTQIFNTPLEFSSGSTQDITFADGFEDGSRTFMMIPQEFNDNAQMVIRFNGKDYTAKLKIVDSENPDNNRLKWEAGYGYLYIISIPGDGKVSLDVKSWTLAEKKTIKF